MQVLEGVAIAQVASKAVRGVEGPELRGPVLDTVSCAIRGLQVLFCILGGRKNRVADGALVRNDTGGDWVQLLAMRVGLALVLDKLGVGAEVCSAGFSILQ